jgi:predicted TIM-barrel fold metal-dependent hydrolase
MTPRIVGVEEHFLTEAVAQAWERVDPRWRGALANLPGQEELARRLSDLDAERLAWMDTVGIDTQVVSLTSPGLQNLEAADATALQVDVNDRLAAATWKHPGRLQAFAALATPAPADAASELHRAVHTLGLDGALVFPRTRERWLDEPQFTPIFEAAAELRAPLYLHPQIPVPAVHDAYYAGLGEPASSALATFGIGWHYDTGVALLRLIFAGVLDRFPDLQIILGHWGEVVLFYLERTARLAEMARLPRTLSEYVRSQVLITPGGILSERYLRWTLEVVGPDRILSATDYPYVPVDAGAPAALLSGADLSDAERDGIASGNWERVRAAIQR